MTAGSAQLDLFSYRPSVELSPATAPQPAPVSRALPLESWTPAHLVAPMMHRQGKELRADAVHFLAPGQAEPIRIALAPLRSFFDSLAEQRMLVWLELGNEDTLIVRYRRPDAERPSGQAVIKAWAWLERYHSPEHAQEKRGRKIRLYRVGPA